MCIWITSRAAGYECAEKLPQAAYSKKTMVSCPMPALPNTTPFRQLQPAMGLYRANLYSAAQNPDHFSVGIPSKKGFRECHQTAGNMRLRKFVIRARLKTRWHFHSTCFLCSFFFFQMNKPKWERQMWEYRCVPSRSQLFFPFVFVFWHSAFFSYVLRSGLQFESWGLHTSNIALFGVCVCVCSRYLLCDARL